MNKKMIFAIIGIALVAFIGFGLYKASGLKSIQIIKTVTIKGTKQEVFDMVKYLNNFPKWSPFLAQDPDQKYEVKGTDGTVGAQYHWDGNKGKDLGYQEIVKIDELSFVGMKCDIQKPFVAKPTFDYYFNETSNGIEVKQDFKLESGLVDAFFMWLFGAKAEMEKTNQQGLELLKKAVENN
ncbi:SRPBCC family protein [Cyclobacterium xiamenense]|uniref:SRPBCC family protein n=1 Tax=Cyclobacterium xiamenense TaxID=1297121 RepID=UPI0035CEEFC5